MITPKTKIIVINSPNTPSGYIYGDGFLKDIADISKEFGLFVFDDECYDALTYDQEFPSIVIKSIWCCSTASQKPLP